MIGKQIQNYQVNAHLGQGGMGTVYRATDLVLGREVAMKMLHSPMISQPQVLDRFRKEAQVLARLLHPNIAVIYNLIEQDQQHFMVMEYVEGKDLDGLLKKHQVLPPMSVITAFIQALEGLHHAHRKGIFHRDIKPSNLILSPDGTIKLMDFGIARVAGEARMTQVNRVIGTVEFLAPELIEGKEPSASSDVYAAGMTMYELLCGRLPFQHNTDYNLMQEILKKRPVSPDKMNHAVPAKLAALVMKALEKKPENRFPDARAFQQALINAYPEAREADLTHLFANAVVPIPHQPTQGTINAWRSRKGKPVAATREQDTAVPLTGTRQSITPGTAPLPPGSASPSSGSASVLPGSASLPPGYLLRLIHLPEMLWQRVAPMMNKRIRVAMLGVLLLFIGAFAVLSQQGRVEEPPPVANGNTPVDVRSSQPSGGGIAKPAVSAPLTDRTPLTFAPEETPVDEAAGRDKGLTNGPGNATPGETNRKSEKKNTGEPGEKDRRGLVVTGNGAGKNDNPSGRQDQAPPVTTPPASEPATEPVPEKSLAARSMTLGSRTEVSLYLREPLSNASQSGQVLSFSVNNPVTYNGQLIIERGSVATGRIKNVGNKKITVVLTSVTGTNGQRLPLQESELSGRIDDMISNRNYSGYLRKGTLVTY